MSQSGPVLSLEHVSYAYQAEPAVEDVSLSVQAGDFVGLIGPNGSGKTTLLRLAVGLLQPGSGRVSLFGTPIDRFRQWPRLGYVPQLVTARAGFPATVAEVVSLGRIGRRGIFRRLTREDWQIVDRSLELVGMAAFRRNLIGELSGGQQQRVLLARALAGEPDLLLLDEAAAGVDVAAKLELLDLLAARCQNSNLAVVFVSHDWETLRPFLNKVALIDRRMLFFGTRQALDEHPRLEEQLLRAVQAIDHHAHLHR